MYMIIAFSIAIHTSYIGSRIVVSLYALQMGASQFTIGVLAALYSTVPLILGVYSGKLVDSTGTRWPLIGGAIVILIGTLIGYFEKTINGLLFTALLAGAGFVFFNVAIQTLTGSYGPVAERSRNFSMLSIGYSISTFIGPVSVGLAIDHIGHQGAFLMLCLFTAPPIIGLLLIRRFNVVKGSHRPKEKTSTLDLLRQPPVRSMVIISGMVVGAWDLFSFYLPIYAHSLHLSATLIGTILGTYAIAALMTRFAMPALLRRYRAERVMFVSLLFAAVCFGFFPLFENFSYILFISFLLGLGLGCGQPLSMLIAYNRSPPGREGEVTGLRLTANNVARVFIPMICAFLGASFGASPVFWLNALNLGAVSLLISKQ